jgi:hypothetical protein
LDHACKIACICRQSGTSEQNPSSRRERGKVRLQNWLGIATLVVTPVATRAQEVRGTVRDSTSGQPVSSAVIALYDANGVAVGRNVSNERGLYRIQVSAPAVRAHVVRLGYRPRDIALRAGLSVLDVVLARNLTMLEAVLVRASPKCPQRENGAAALALFEQARAGLLSTIVAREANPATIRLLSFMRTMDGSSDRIERMTVRVDSADRMATSFKAEKSGEEFVNSGFTREDGGGRIYSGPDADVLLDDGFAAGYCFRLADSERARPTQVGLGFFPADSKRGRTDIEGTLWVDTLTRSLRDIEFKYVGLPGNSHGVDPGGHIFFREMPNGVVLIDRWTLRIAATRMRNGSMHGFAYESGGEVARASWADGTHWEAELGSITLHLRQADGHPAKGAIVFLDSTEYIGVADTAGDVTIRELLAGPYKVVFLDTTLAPTPIRIASTLTFEAHRGLVDEKTLQVPTEDDFLQVPCRADKASQWHRIVALNDIDGSPASAAKWEVGQRLGEPGERVMGKGTVRVDGTRGVCLRPPERVRLTVRAISADGQGRSPVVTVADDEKIVLRVVP